MSPILLALVGFVALLLLLALFGRPTVARARQGASGSRTYPPEELAAVTERLLRAMGFRVERLATRNPRAIDFLALDNRPVAGQRLYVRALALEDGAAAGPEEVQAASDQIRGEGLHKALLISPAGFTDEALAAAGDTQVELVNGPQLSALLERQKTQDPQRLGAPQPTVP